MKIKGTYSDNEYAKCNMHFDPIKLEFTYFFNKNLKVNGILEKDSELKLIFKTHECHNYPYKKTVEKITNTGYYMNLNLFFFERKKVFFI